VMIFHVNAHIGGIPGGCRGAAQDKDERQTGKRIEVRLISQRSCPGRAVGRNYRNRRMERRRGTEAQWLSGHQAAKLLGHGTKGKRRIRNCSVMPVHTALVAGGRRDLESPEPSTRDCGIPPDADEEEAAALQETQAPAHRARSRPSGPAATARSCASFPACSTFQ
jgi:hypothetical protein